MKLISNNPNPSPLGPLVGIDSLLTSKTSSPFTVQKAKDDEHPIPVGALVDVITFDIERGIAYILHERMLYEVSLFREVYVPYFKPELKVIHSESDSIRRLRANMQRYNKRQQKVTQQRRRFNDSSEEWI